MKILYLTANVLGDSGANAAEIFPRFAMQHHATSEVYSADYERNKDYIVKEQYAFFVKLVNPKGLKADLRNARRLAKVCKHEAIDIVHAFYRVKSINLIFFLRVFLILYNAKARIIVDHRSINLRRGFGSFFKKLYNGLLPLAAHELAGNPNAVETNYLFRRNKKFIFDLGYDDIAFRKLEEVPPDDKTHIWFVGSMKPQNRKTDFLLDVYDDLEKKLEGNESVVINVAGSAKPEQIERLRKNKLVKYHGSLRRDDLYALMATQRGIGLSFMNKEFHMLAPSLKFVEYAYFDMRIFASDTDGLRLQGKRMGLGNIKFLPEKVDAWSNALMDAQRAGVLNEQVWRDKEKWSYQSLFNNQVIEGYKKICNIHPDGKK